MGNDDKPMGRRRFFRAGLAEILKPLANVAIPLEELAKQLGKMDAPRAAAAPLPQVNRAPNTVSYSAPQAEAYGGDDEQHWIRPPGARIEVEFTSICSRCGNCVHACPVNAIILDHSGADGAGVPYIDPEKSACVMCQDLSCMSQCPSSALQLIPREDIDMGTAVWDSASCIRSRGEQCTMCVDHCPVGPAAIEVLDNNIVVHEDHCTGCGACQNNCPTQPRSIAVTPKSKRDQQAPPA